MEWIWLAWFLVFIVSFAVFERHAIKNKRVTLSATIWWLSKEWPLLPFLCGLVVGGLAVHFWWPMCGLEEVGK